MASPLEARRTLFGFPLEGWSPTPEGSVLYEVKDGKLERRTSDLNLGSSQLRSVKVGEDGNSLEFKTDVVIFPAKSVYGSGFEPLTIEEEYCLQRGDLRKMEKGYIPTNTPLVRKQVRFVPEE